MIIESIISALVGMGVSSAVKKVGETDTHGKAHVSNVDRSIIGYDVLSGLYTPLPADSTAENYVNSREDVKKRADYSTSEWVTTTNSYDTPGRSGGVNVPAVKMNNKEAGKMLYQGFDVITGEL
ncbi:MAG: hypothetical protein WC936_06570 [Candidatus Nanoarchaeia archaeon]|jgi:hypothetical protein